MRTKLLVLVCLLLCAAGVRAQNLTGNACPSQAYYMAQDGKTFVTLASRGITKCYFAAANGSDSNDGASEQVTGTGHGPWLHIPGMPNCSGTCATVKAGSQNGIGYLLRGGDTWHLGNSALSPYTGGAVTYQSGTSTISPSYTGFDWGWFSGASWHHPIFNVDNPTSTSSVSSCTYKVGGSPLNNNPTSLSGKYSISDGIEITGLCQDDVAQIYPRTGQCAAFQGSTYDAGTNNIYTVIGGGPDVELVGGYEHGFTHTPFGNPSAPENCIVGSNTFNSWSHRGSAGGSGTVLGDLILDDLFDFSDSDPIAMGGAYTGQYLLAYDYYNYTNVSIQTQVLSMHDVTWNHANDNGHSDIIEVLGQSYTTALYYNIDIINFGCNKSQGLMWPFGVGTKYIFNFRQFNVCSTGGLEDVAVGGTPAFPGNGVFGYFNNTIQVNDTTGVNPITCASAIPTTDYNGSFSQNDHIIYATGTSAYGGECPSLPSSNWFTKTDLPQSNSQAATFYPYGSGGYPTQTFPFAPVTTSSPTVNAGTNLMSICNTLSADSNSFIAQGGADCKFSTNGGVAVDQNLHMVCTRVPAGAVTTTCPTGGFNLIRAARPATGPWDIGAYQGIPVPSGGGGGGGQVATPTPSQIPGAYAPFNLSLSTTTAGASIIYTTDDSTPTESGCTPTGTGHLYSGPIALSATTTIQAIGCLAGDTDSGAFIGNYVINQGPTCVTSNGSTWTSTSFTSQNSSFSATLTATPNSVPPVGSGPVIGLSSSAVSTYASNSVLIRQSGDGFWEVYNGTNATYQSDTPASWDVGTPASFTISVTWPAQTATVSVTQAGGACATGCTIATNYPFRASATSLGFWNLDNLSNTLTVCNFAVAGTGSPSITFSPNPVNFGSSPLTVAKNQTITITNSGNANLVLTSSPFSVSGSAFSAALGTCTASETLTPGQNCTITGTFTPTVAGNATGTLTINSNASGSVTLTGNGIVLNVPTGMTLTGMTTKGLKVH